jgi:hypothetical protein
MKSIASSGTQENGCLFLKRDRTVDSPAAVAGLSWMKRGLLGWVEREVQRDLGIVFVDEVCQLETTMQRQFFHDVMHVAFHRVGGNVEPLSNFFVAQTVGNQHYDFTLALRHSHYIGRFSFPLRESKLNHIRKE